MVGAVCNCADINDDVDGIEPTDMIDSKQFQDTVHRFIELYGDRTEGIGDEIHAGLAWIEKTQICSDRRRRSSHTPATQLASCITVVRSRPTI